MILSGAGIIIPVYVNTILDKWGGTGGGGAAGYSLRSLRRGYTGSSIRVRRSSDDTEQDIGFTNIGRLDTLSLTGFVGTGSGYIAKWYDQSGNGKDAEQSTTGSQPRIVNSGTLDTLNGNPSIYFDGSDDFLSISSNWATSDLTGILVGSRGGTGTEDYIYDNSNDPSYGGGYSLRYRTNDTIRGWVQSADTNANSTSTYTDNSQRLISQYGKLLGGTETNVLRVNGVEVNNNSGSITTRNTKTTTRIGNSELFGGYYIGYMQELIVWASYESTNISGIETDINSYYFIY